MSELGDLRARVNVRRRELDIQHGSLVSLVTRGRALKTEVAHLDEQVRINEQVTHVLNSIGEERQYAAQSQIEEMVTRGLQTIFDDSLSFHIVQTVKGKTAQVEFVVRTTREHDVIDTPVIEARGGGVAATIGFLLRVVIMLLRDGTRSENLLVLDETFAMVSAEYLPSLIQFVKEIVDNTGIQIVMVTHQPEWMDYADKVYRFSQSAGVTRAVEA